MAFVTNSTNAQPPAFDNRVIIAWLALCPLLALATTWWIALALAVWLLVTISLTAAGLALLQRYTQPALRLPLAALIAGTVVVLLQLATAASPIRALQLLDATVAQWLVLVAGLAVLVCCLSDKDIEPLSPRERGRGEGPIKLESPDSARTLTRASRTERGLHGSFTLAVALSAALLLIGIARDAFGRVFLIAATPAGVLVLLALLLALASSRPWRGFRSPSMAHPLPMRVGNDPLTPALSPLGRGREAQGSGEPGS